MTRPAKAIKVAILSYRFDEKYGTGTIRTRSFYQALSDAKISVEVFDAEPLQGNRLKWLKLCFSVFKGKSHDYYYLSLGPYFPLLPLALFAWMFRGALILDYRDPLSQNIDTKYGRDDYRFRGLKLMIAYIVEKFGEIVADQVWVCTPGMKEYYAKRFQSRKVHVVFNGFNMSKQRMLELREYGQAHRYPVKTYICLGKFGEYSHHKARHYLEAIRSRHPAEAFKIILVGCDRNLNEKIVQELGMQNKVVFVPWLQESEALLLASQCHYGIVLIREEDFGIGTKIFDYLGMGLPIFGCFEENKSFYKFMVNYLNRVVALEDLDEYVRSNIWKRAIEEHILGEARD